MTASADSGTQRLSNLSKAITRLLAACRNDASLHEPANPQVSMPPATPGSTKGIKTYKAKGFSFSYPKVWKVSSNKECLNLNEPNVGTNEEYTLNL